MRLIGDVHGKYSRYRELIRDVPSSIQVGDMGVGFRRSHGPRAGELWPNPPHAAMIKGNHRFIRGNHDNPAECAKHSQWIADGKVEDDVMFIGGAFSIDKAYRINNYSWWEDEELSYVRLRHLIQDYIAVQPRVMITHDCPREVGELLASRGAGVGGVARVEGSRTAQAFQEMWSAHSPVLWVFGHWHHSFDHVLHGGREKGTRFVCLAELEARDDLV